MKKITSIDLFIHEIHHILDSRDLKGYTHFQPRPPNNYHHNFYLSWICITMQKIRLFHQCLERQPVLNPWTRVATSIFDLTYTNIFHSTFNFCEFVSTCKKSGYFITLFQRYIWLKNPVICLAQSILAHFSGTKLFRSTGFVQECHK